ncbi:MULTISPECIES: peptidylprolyl isomerase [Pseudoalteromonas]|jgi:FKBP-type peptidyl-prolyl cis-trans isomerase SlyD|uniref:Peptidyl-prolyl cis-trans isomerase n=2 Tax=Pseudoalteromonas TaxID=53246 RepID=A0A0F4NYU1_PSEO7|nr:MULTISPECIES: peptidylprolyl isomerase [Pseudoalteromonas]ASD66515.1 peptidylprolyl isomerase [Pseudoalteromonas piscicida]ATD07005.1 FKBP-type peptidyl-prolyl cis-trans isomerase SlyD [Pseudoalteromonas piscicida]AXQ97438.1 peptidylprolyl isomerase [Pseudoalteromonas piscicida]AXR02771.1 peptidylprolyl isomerase [Pseudoalteromonas piscicida]KID32983.1 peptidylprolyl isomerase [Pseudoalteromonas flavipulchra NCIMB 2033 = ATCC BAA-314]
MIIGPNSVVTIHYSVQDKDNNTIDSTFDDEPVIAMLGSGYLIPGLDDALQGKQAGDTFSVTIEPQEGYGERFDELTQAVPKSMFEDMEIEVGMQFRATTDEGDQIVVIIGIEDEEVIVDANHPLSGITLNFDVEVLEVREATAEEVAHGHVHGEGGCGHDH